MAKVFSRLVVNFSFLKLIFSELQHQSAELGNEIMSGQEVIQGGLNKKQAMHQYAIQIHKIDLIIKVMQ